MISKFLAQGGRPALLVLSLLLVSCAAVPAPKLPPAGSAELIGNFLLALDQDRLFEDAFYTDEAIKAFTGGGEVQTSVVVEQPKRTLETKVALLQPTPGAGLETYISLRRKITDGRIVEVSGRFEFIGIGGGMEEVMSRLGQACHEDFETERATFDAVAREPFNPPAKPVFMATCDLAPSKIGPKNWISLDFGGDRRLHGVYFKAG